MKNKKTFIILGAVLLCLFLLFILFLIRGNEDDWICKDGQWLKHGNPKAAMPTEQCAGAKEINSFEECASAGQAIMESYPRQCAADGKTFVENIGNGLEKADLIRVSNPRPNQTISSPLLIEGEARGGWFFEASFPVKLYDANGQLIGSAIAQANGDWMTDNFVPFRAELNFNYASTTNGTSTNGTLVLENDNPSGLPQNANQLTLPVKFSLNETAANEPEKTAEKVKVKVYFNNNKLDPEVTCNKVFPVEREIAKTPAIARAALEELLAGTTKAENEAGFITSLNSNIKIQSLTIVEGIAKVDFNEQLEAGVGGSCKVAAISAQIRETLKQFPSVQSVIISINGRSEDILQP